jgi:DNA-binding response OmpR family regulator
MANVLMIGLDDGIAQQIERITTQANHSVLRSAMKADFDARPDADLVFLSGDRRDYLSALRSIRSYHNAPPVIVVTRLPETSDWLDSLEAGAADYCSAPFEPVQIRWILDSALSHPRAFAAA